MRIVAIGGGGFSSDDGPDLDDYILAAANLQHPRVGFICAASGDSDAYVLRFYRAFNRRGLAVRDIGLFNQDGRAAETIADLDVIYVGGGNTVNLLAIWRIHGLVEPLRAAYQRGAVLCGVSAGAMCRRGDRFVRTAAPLG
jgi:peptidase E